MGNVANRKTIGKFIFKSDFLILLIRAREGVFLLINCCDCGITQCLHGSKSVVLVRLI